jgi:hypothetical protein
MARKQAYLIRGSDGCMRTVQAFSPRGAAKEYLRKYKPKKGELLSVKPRGHGDWSDFQVT